MPEPEPAGNFWHLGQHAAGQCRAGGIHLYTGRGGGDRDLDLEAGDGGGMHEPLGGSGQPLDPVRNRLADGLRHAGRATVVEASAELDDEERVPVARRPHCVEVAPMSRPQQTRHRRLFQAAPTLRGQHPRALGKDFLPEGFLAGRS